MTRVAVPGKLYKSETAGLVNHEPRADRIVRKLSSKPPCTEREMVRGTYVAERRLIALGTALAGPGTPACVAAVEMGEPGVVPASIGIPEPDACTAVAGVGVGVASTAVAGVGVASTVPGIGVTSTGASGGSSCPRAPPA